LYIHTTTTTLTTVCQKPLKHATLHGPGSIQSPKDPSSGGTKCQRRQGRSIIQSMRDLTLGDSLAEAKPAKLPENSSAESREFMTNARGSTGRAPTKNDQGQDALLVQILTTQPWDTAQNRVRRSRPVDGVDDRTIASPSACSLSVAHHTVNELDQEELRTPVYRHLTAADQQNVEWFQFQRRWHELSGWRLSLQRPLKTANVRQLSTADQPSHYCPVACLQCAVHSGVQAGYTLFLLMNAQILMFLKKKVKQQKYHHKKLGSAEGKQAQAPPPMNTPVICSASAYTIRTWRLRCYK